METALKALEKAIVTGRLKDRNKMERRLGKIQARHPQVNDLYDLALRDTPAGVRLFWKMKEDRRNWRESREGAYLLRTNLQAETAEELFISIRSGEIMRTVQGGIAHVAWVIEEDLSDRATGLRQQQVEA
jgi:hypothetical protein